MGSRVALHDYKWDEELVVSLVGAFEADPDSGLVSIDSPLGAALIGKHEGDEIEVSAPSGVQKYRVKSIAAAD